jgi:spermidine/putrescine transport system substrate-binding protein/spermidine/putrescine transport system permease protein
MAFINHVLEPEESVLITAEFPYSNPNAAALEYLKANDPDAYTAYMGYAATNPSAEFLAAAVPVKDVAEATTLYDALWTDFKGE